MNSDRLINYKLRPAKSVERKMIKDILGRLFPFGGSPDYKYVGFGAKYFVDFSLFHKHLHIDEMVSIERNTGNRKMYEFNRPFNCIKIEYGESNDVLPKLKYDKKVIAWLDNDGLLTKDVLTDVSTLVTNCIPGSIMMISYNSRPPKIQELKKLYESEKDVGIIRKMIVEQIGEEHLPVGFTEDGLGKWSNYSKLLATIINNHIKKQLAVINYCKDEDDVLHFKQLIYFDYNDNVEMSTFGGILYKAGDLERVEKCGFDTFDFVKTGPESYKIEVPNFTYKEMAHLYENMPIENVENLGKLGLDDKIFPTKDVLSFSRVYKYFPNFFESDLF